MILLSTPKELQPDRDHSNTGPINSTLPEFCNPADWHSWGREPFSEAKRLDKPVFVFIGSSHSYWTDVMIRESFQDPQLTGVLTSAFVCIRVDFDQAPPAVRRHMASVSERQPGQTLPLLMMMTPDEIPFIAKSYLPRKSHAGHMGMMEFIVETLAKWKSWPGEPAAADDNQTPDDTLPTMAEHDTETEIVESAYAHFTDDFELPPGQFGCDREFPTPLDLIYALRQYHGTGNAEALASAENLLSVFRGGDDQQANGRGFHAAGNLLRKIGLYRYSQAAFASARKALSDVLELHEQVYGLSHPEVGDDCNNLGLVSMALGDLEDARDQFRRALIIYRVSYGADHPLAATATNNLGLVARSLGELPEAVQHFERALRIDEAAHGSTHPRVGTRLNNLGGALCRQGELDAAEDHCQRALEILEPALGPGHPSVAGVLCNLALIRKSRGDLTGALDYYQRALQIDEAAYGPDHPEVAGDLKNIAEVSFRLGDLADAQDRLERTATIIETAFGPHHPQLATIIRRIGRIQINRGALRDAKRSYHRALKIYEMAFGSNHAAVAVSSGDLGEVHLRQGNMEGAELYYTRARQIDERNHSRSFKEWSAFAIAV